MTALFVVLFVLACHMAFPSLATAKSQLSTAKSFPAGSYIIDMGVNTTSKPNGLRPYGLLYRLLRDTRTPVSWVIADGKAGGYGSAATGLNAPDVDFTASVVRDGAGTAATSPVTSQSYWNGAFVISAEFVTAAVDAAVTTFAATTVVDKAAASFTAPVYDTLYYWPKAVLDAANGKLAVPYYTNAGVPETTSSYIWKSPSELDSCDDIYVMPHADPTWSTHSNLKVFNNSGGYIWAGCHAPSVLENLVNPSSSADRMNFLSNDGLIPFGKHSGGSPPYNYNTDGSDPVLQIGGVLDAATLNGSEQIYLPKAAGWRPSTVDLAWDASQANVPGTSPGEARVLTYGRGFGQASNGMVMYEGGHSLDKGTVGDVPAQRAFFNFLLLGGLERAPKATLATSGTTQLVAGGTTTLTADVSGGHPGYTYEWSSTCGGTFSARTGALSEPGTVTTTFTAPTLTSATGCGIRVVITDQCGRQPFGAVGLEVTPAADLAITKTVSSPTVSVNGTIAYTLAVTNNGPGTAKTPTVTDTLPPGTQASFLSATPNPASNASGTLTWNLADLSPGESRTITVALTALEAGAIVVNTAEVSSTTPDTATANNTASVSTRVLNSGIRIEKVARPAIIPSAGGAVTFEFVVHNSGTDPLTNVAVSDNPTCTLVGPTGDLNGDGILAAPLDGVETEVWRYTCTRTVTTATADVAVSSGGHSGGIPALDASSFTKQDVVQATATDPGGNPVRGLASTVVTIANPGISVTKALEPTGQNPAPGTSATFRVVVSNSGNVPLLNVDTADVWAGTCDTATIADLGVGQSHSMLCTATTPGATASDGFAAISYSGGTGWTGAWVDSQDGSASAGEVQVVAGTGLPTGYSADYVLSYAGNKRTLIRTVDLAGRSNAVVTFLYNRSADFNKDDRDFTVSASPDGTTWTSLTSISPTRVESADTGWSTYQATIPSAAIGAATRIRFGNTSTDLSNRAVYLDDVRVLGSQVNSVTATGTDAFGTTVTATATAQVTPGVPVLAVTKTASTAGPLYSGDTYTYSVTVTNTGSGAQTNLAVTDALPSGLSLNGAVTAVRSAYTASATDDFGTIKSYSTGTGWAGAWTETGEVTDADGGKIKVVTDKGNPVSSLLLDPDNKQYSIQRAVNLGAATSGTLQFQCSREAFTADPDPLKNDSVVLSVNGIVLRTFDSTTALCPTDNGDTWGTLSVALPAGAFTSPAQVAFTVTGDKKFRVDNLTVSASVPSATVTAGDPPDLTSAGGSYDLAPGASVTFTIPVTVTGTPGDGFQFSNLVQATSSQQTSPVTAAVTTPYAAPDFTITKTAVETWVNASGAVLYRIELKNTGNTALQPTSVSDPSCASAPSLQQGDLNTDGWLQLGETWLYTCTRSVSTPNSPPDPDVVTNTATASLKDASGATVTPESATAEVRVVHPVLSLEATPATTVISPGSAVAYTYTLTNDGDIGLVSPTVSAANCAPLTYQGGDSNGDGVLDVSEAWAYTCTTGPVDAVQVNQWVTATARDLIFNSSVQDSATVSIYLTPTLSITKTASDTVSGASGSSISVGTVNWITYTYQVQNTSGASGLAVSSAVVADDKCTPADPVTAGGHVVGDTDQDDQLDPDETWTFSCTTGTLARTTTNTASASGTYTVAGVTGTVEGQAQATATVAVLTPRLRLGKQTSTEYVRSGGTATFTFTVENVGATSFALDRLGAAADKAVSTDGTITATDACAPLVGPSFPHDPSYDVNGNGLLDPGDILSYTCATAIATETIDAFTLGTSTDVLGSSYAPEPAFAHVFALDPDFTVTKTATTTIGGTGTEIVGEVGQPVSYTITVAHTLAATGGSTDELNALKLTVTDPLCASPPQYQAGDLDADGVLNPAESWTLTCTLDALPDGDPTLATSSATENTVTVVGEVNAREFDEDGDPSEPLDGLAPITHTATATVTPVARAITVLKQAENCDVGEPTCPNDLPGAQFALYASDPAQPGPTTPITDGITNDPTGSATFRSRGLLVNHDYWLVETKAPDGFQLLAQPIKFHLTTTALTLDPASASSMITADPTAFTITITDVPAADLPNVGGSGFWPFLAIGLVLFAAAALQGRRPSEGRIEPA